MKFTYQSKNMVDPEEISAAKKPRRKALAIENANFLLPQILMILLLVLNAVNDYNLQ